MLSSLTLLVNKGYVRRLACSDTFTVGCILMSQCTASDRRTDNSIMPIADRAVWSAKK